METLQCSIIHRNEGEKRWIFTKPQSAEINIQHFYRHFIYLFIFFLVIELW